MSGEGRLIIWAVLAFIGLFISAGAVIGAQFGARQSHHVGGVLIVRLLAVGLAIVALRSSR